MVRVRCLRPNLRQWREGSYVVRVRIINLTFEVAFPFSVTAPYAISRKCV